MNGVTEPLFTKATYYKERNGLVGAHRFFFPVLKDRRYIRETQLNLLIGFPIFPLFRLLENDWHFLTFST